MSQYQKGKTNLDFTEARDSEWHWHQLGHMQVSTTLQTDNHASTPPLSFFTGRMPFLPPNQQRQALKALSCYTDVCIFFFTFLRAVCPGCPGKEAVKCVCVCVLMKLIDFVHVCVLCSGPVSRAASRPGLVFSVTVYVYEIATRC